VDIAELLAFSVKNKASDLHLSAGMPPMIRVHGDVRRINLPPLEHKDVHGMAYDIMSDSQRKMYEETLEIDFSFAIPNLARFRVNAFVQERGAAVVFGVILGTGVGGGIVIDGRALRGANAIAGEWGHNPLPWGRTDEMPGRPCYCGRTGCIETWLSGPGLAADYAAAAESGVPLKGEEIVARAAAGDRACNAALERYEDRLARALASVINILDPDVIVLGGGISNADRWYRSVPKLWGGYVFSDSVRTRLLRNMHGDSSGVRGAAWLW